MGRATIAPHTGPARTGSAAATAADPTTRSQSQTPAYRRCSHTQAGRLAQSRPPDSRAPAATPAPPAGAGSAGSDGDGPHERADPSAVRAARSPRSARGLGLGALLGS